MPLFLPQYSLNDNHRRLLQYLATLRCGVIFLGWAEPSRAKQIVSPNYTLKVISDFGSFPLTKPSKLMHLEIEQTTRGASSHPQPLKSYLIQLELYLPVRELQP